MGKVIVISKRIGSKKQCVKLKSKGFDVAFFSDIKEFENKKVIMTEILAVFFDVELFSEGYLDCSLEKLRNYFKDIPLFLWCERSLSTLENYVIAFGLSGVILYSDTIQSICKKLQMVKEKKESIPLVFPKILDDIVGDSDKIVALKKKILTLAKSNLPVLLLGETGSGKNLTARIIHNLSNFAEGSFVQTNPARLPLDICEAELFGYKKGSFTGALDNKIGLFEQADGGTLFLDEIDSIPYPIQAKLLTAIDEGKIWRIGERCQKVVHTRIISATNVSLSALENIQTMREDFFHRIAGDILTLPPLREHLEDLPALVEHFLSSQAEPKELSVSAFKKLYTNEWKGNVRELNLTLLRAIKNAKSFVILSSDIVFF